MREVAIAAYATTKFKRTSETSLFEIACEPCRDILTKCEILKKEVDAVIFSSCSVEQYTSSIVSDMLGLSPKICHRIDNLCNSGTNAIVCAFSYISSGLCDSALIVGAEKINTTGQRLTWDVTRGEYGLPGTLGRPFRQSAHEKVWNYRGTNGQRFGKEPFECC